MLMNDCTPVVVVDTEIVDSANTSVDTNVLNTDVLNTEVLDTEVLIECPKCGRMKPRSARNQHMCVDCEKAENSRYSYYRSHQDNWMDVAADAGLDLWLQQPGETQWEYTVWCAYRDAYPGKKPTYRQVAEQLGTTLNVVKKIAQRWSFAVRMQAWMVECDRITMAQRRQEILDMNKAHVDMAERLRFKLSEAIDSLDPRFLEPKDISSLFKLSSELERKARVDTVAQEELLRDVTSGTENPELKKSPTKKDDLSEVVQILLGAGALGNVEAVGLRKTETTEVVVKGGNSSYEVESNE